jgi:hypothetical protein
VLRPWHRIEPGPDQIHLGPVRMRILEDGGSTGHRLGISGPVLPPHTPGPPQHRHARHDEGFYIVCGIAVFTVVMISTFTPDLYVQYFRDMTAFLRNGAR